MGTTVGVAQIASETGLTRQTALLYQGWPRGSLIGAMG
jgi:hypothetical protein